MHYFIHRQFIKLKFNSYPGDMVTDLKNVKADSLFFTDGTAKRFNDFAYYHDVYCKEYYDHAPVGKIWNRGEINFDVKLNYSITTFLLNFINYLTFINPLVATSSYHIIFQSIELGFRYTDIHKFSLVTQAIKALRDKYFSAKTESIDNISQSRFGDTYINIGGTFIHTKNYLKVKNNKIDKKAPPKVELTFKPKTAIDITTAITVLHSLVKFLQLNTTVLEEDNQLLYFPFPPESALDHYLLGDIKNTLTKEVAGLQILESFIDDILLKCKPTRNLLPIIAQLRKGPIHQAKFKGDIISKSAFERDKKLLSPLLKRRKDGRWSYIYELDLLKSVPAKLYTYIDTPATTPTIAPTNSTPPTSIASSDHNPPPKRKRGRPRKLDNNNINSPP